MSEPIQIKYCSHCKQFKPISEFGRNRNNKDGVQLWCKFCHKVYEQTEKCKATRKRYRQTEKGKDVQRRAIKKHRQTEKGKATHRAIMKRYEKSEKGKATRKTYIKSEKGKARQKRFYNCHPNNLKAKTAVNNAIRSGKLPRANTLLCHYCPKPAQQYHHWHGYEPEHWLDVVPVCVKCHREIHNVSDNRPFQTR